MYRAICSKKELHPTAVLKDKISKEYQECVSGILNHSLVQEMDNHFQHCQTSRLQHSINVSYYAYRMCRLFGWDYKSAARAGLMHDLYFYSWTDDKSERGNHLAKHPLLAFENAKKVTEINAIEEDAIVKHMWPCTIVPPKYKESYAVTIADKVCTVVEVVERLSSRSLNAVSKKLRNEELSMVTISNLEVE